MAVSGVDRNSSSPSRSAEETQRLKKEYQEREIEEKSRHEREVARIHAANAKNIEAMREKNQEQVGKIIDRSRETLSEKDQKYQSEIEDIRKMHMQKLKGLTDKFGQEKEMLQENRDQEIASERRASQIRNDSQKEIFEAKLDDGENRLEKAYEMAGKEQKAAINNMRHNLVEKYEKDIDIIKDQKAEQTGSLKRELESTKFQKNRELDNLKQERNRQLAERDDMSSDQRLEERRENNKILDYQREVSQGAVKAKQEKYNAQLDEMRKDYDKAWTHLQGDDSARIKVRVQGLENANEQLRMDKNIAINKMNQERRAEKEVFRREALTEREAVENHKHAALEDIRERNYAKIEDIQRENDGKIADTREYYQEKISELKQNEIEPYRQQNEELKLQAQGAKFAQDIRNDRTRALYAKELNKNEDFRKEQEDLIRRNSEKQIGEIKEALVRDKNETVTNLQVRMKENEVLASNKLNQQIDRSNEEMLQVKEGHRKEMHRIKEAHDQRIKAKDKEMLERLETERFYREKLMAEAKESHAREISQLKRAHEAEKIELAKKPSST